MTTVSPARGHARIPGLDGLRGASALCVIVAHTFALTAPAVTARLHAYLVVQMLVLFFVLSGFLILLPFCRAAAAGRPGPSLRLYAATRLLRIYPAYVVTFLLANLALGAVYVRNAVEVNAQRSDAGTGRILDPGVILSHLSLGQNLAPSQLQTGLNPSWSLTTELGFYLIAPLLAVGMGALVRRHGWGPRAALMPAASMLAVGLITKVLLEWQQRVQGLTDAEAQFGATWHAVIARSVLGLADAFAPGLLVVAVFVTMQHGGLRGWSGRRLHVWGGAATAVGVVAGVFCVEQQLPFDSTCFAFAAGTFLLMVVEPTARGRRAVLGRVVDIQPLRFLGAVSLSAYLWHYPVLILVTRHDLIGPDTLLGVVWSVALVLGITTPLAWLSHRFVEVPTMRQARRAREKTSAA